MTCKSNTIKIVFQHGYPLETAKNLKNLAALLPKNAVVTTSGYDALTLREQEVLVMLAERLSSKQIAEKLLISPKTAENHRSSIMRKLALHSSIDLARYAARMGMIGIDLWKA